MVPRALAVLAIAGAAASAGALLAQPDALSAHLLPLTATSTADCAAPARVPHEGIPGTNYERTFIAIKVRCVHRAACCIRAACACFVLRERVNRC
jgi:hypothetical protein